MKTSEFAIEKDVPPPERTRGAPHGNQNRTIYPFQKLEVGESFLVRGKTSSELRGTMSHHNRTSDRRFTIRQTPFGARIWRVK